MPRQTELDRLRGLLLILMTITHLPVRFSAYTTQPLGFVSAAEGFVLLSAYFTSLGANPCCSRGNDRCWRG